LEAFYPNITKAYQVPNKCHKIRKKPRRRKKPGGGEEEEESGDEGQLDNETKVYNSITDKETSKLNSCDRITRSWLVLVAILSAILFWS
jgi:hypothetical protein